MVALTQQLCGPNQKDQSMDVHMRVTKVGMQLEGDAEVMVMWKRGPREDYTDSFKMTKTQDQIDLDFKFKTVCTFFRDNKGGFKQKVCEFHLNQVDNGFKKFIGK